MSTDLAAAARVSFCRRIPAADFAATTYKYDKIHQGNNSEPYLSTHHVPAVDDLIYLYDPVTKTGESYRVVKRAWEYVGYGSVYWPPGQRQSSVGPLITVILEPADGPFADEAEGTDDDE